MEPSKHSSFLTIVEDDLKAVQEFDIKTLKYKDIWAVCSQLKIKGVKNAMKEQMIKKVFSYTRSRPKRYDKLADTSNPAATRKEPQCPYILLNILFSDVFAEGFSQLENVADCAALDAEKAANNQLFWEGVQEAFRGQDKAYGNLHFTDD